MYKKYTGDRKLLQTADKFLVELCEIPMLSVRLDLLFTIREFPANLESFAPVSLAEPVSQAGKSHLWVQMLMPSYVSLLPFTVFCRVSTRLRVNTHPPFLMILWFALAYIYIRTCIRLLHVTAHPRFWPMNFKHPWALTRENTVLTPPLLVPPLHLQTLDLAWQACSELINSTAFVDLLPYVLAIGNYLNAGARQGGAYGFKLATLPKVYRSGRYM